MKKVIGILLIFISVAMIGSGIYLMNSSKYIFETTLTGVFNYLVDGYVDYSESINTFNDVDKLKWNTNTSLNQNQSSIASLDGDVYIDGINKKLYLDLDTTVTDKEFIGVEGLVEQNRIYLKIKEIMDVFYYSEFDMSMLEEEIKSIENSQLLNLKREEVELLTKYLKNSILKDLKDSDFTKTSETLVLEGKNYKTSKVTLKLSEKDMGTIIENLLTSISEDNKAIQVLQKIDKNIEKTDIDNALKSLTEVKSSYSEDDVLSISLYVEGFGGLRRVELQPSSNEVDSVATTTNNIALDIYNNSYKNKSYAVSLVVDGVELLSLKIENVSDSSTNIALKLSDVQIEGTYSITDTSEEFTFDVLSNAQKMGTINYKVTTISKDKEYKVEFSFLMTEEGIDITSTNNIVLNEDIPNVDVSDAIDFEDMTEEDQQKISEFINEKLELIGLGTTEEDSQYDDIEI